MTFATVAISVAATLTRRSLCQTDTEATVPIIDKTSLRCNRSIHLPFATVCLILTPLVRSSSPHTATNKLKGLPLFFFFKKKAPVLILTSHCQFACNSSVSSAGIICAISHTWTFLIRRAVVDQQTGRPEFGIREGL